MQLATAHRTNRTDWLVSACLFLLPLACWPGLQRPFSVPKLWLALALDTAILGALLWDARARATTSDSAIDLADALCLAWLAAVSLSALVGSFASLEPLLLALAPLPLFWTLRRPWLSADKLLWAIVAGTWLLSLIAILQYFHLDPVAWLGTDPSAFTSPRMRVYGTMGNPNFVAAWCSATLPLAYVLALRNPSSLRLRALVAFGTALQLTAIFATGSRILLLALVPQLLLLLRSRATRAWILTVGLIAGSALLYFSPARSVVTTVEGRAYLTTIPAAHWRSIPVAGDGPGSFETRFAQWQLESLKSAPAAPDARFATEVDHAHNDYIEIFVEYGWLGMTVFLGLSVFLIARCWRLGTSLQPFQLAAACSVLGLLAIALVDFPFHRPAEWSLFWLMAGLLTGRTQSKETVVCRTAYHA